MKCWSKKHSVSFVYFKLLLVFRFSFFLQNSLKTIFTRRIQFLKIFFLLFYSEYCKQSLIIITLVGFDVLSFLAIVLLCSQFLTNQRPGYEYCKSDLESVYFRKICTVSIAYYILSNDSLIVLNKTKDETKSNILIHYHKNTNSLKKN